MEKHDFYYGLRIYYVVCKIQGFSGTIYTYIYHSIYIRVGLKLSYENHLENL